MRRRRFLLLSMAPIAGAMSCKLLARPMDDDIPTKGRWPNGGDSNNSLTPPCNVVVTLSGSTLYITGAACGSPVSVSIYGIGFVYHDIFADSDANNIMIDLSSAPSGVYSLHITNLQGGYLDGSFNL